MSSLSERSQVCLYLLAYVTAWTAMRWLMDANLDPFGDMLEAHSWGRTFLWGTFKHPPLMAWLAGLWFGIFPTGDSAFHILAYLSVAIGLLGVYEFATAVGLKSYAVIALLLLTMAFPYSTLAVKFNANTTILMLWPWIAMVFVRSVQAERNSSEFVRSILLGTLAALAMLGKYYTALFLAGLFMATLLTARGRGWYSTYRPWVALVTFAICLTPHLFWLTTHDYATVRYVAQQGEGRIFWDRILEFGLAPLYFWIVPWLLCSIVTAPAPPRRKGIFMRLARSWRLQGSADSLWWMVMAPWVISIAFGLSGLFRLKGPWAIPIGFGFPLLWLRNLAPVHDQMLFAQQTIRKVFWYALAAGLILAPAYTFWEASNAFQNYYVPRRVMAREVLREWHQRYPGKRLRWVGGTWAENAAVAFYEDPAIRTIPGLPDQMPALVSPVEDWSSTPGLLLCHLGRVGPGENVPIAERNSSCIDQTQEWIIKHGKVPDVIRLRVHRDGWRFPERVEFDYVAFAYFP